MKKLFSEGYQSPEKLENLTPDSAGEIVVYQPKVGNVKLDVRIEDETVWLSQQQMAQLFDITKQNISHHISNIFKERELKREVVVKHYLTTTQHGAQKGKVQTTKMMLYNLDVIISVGYRVKSVVGTRFRQWANQIIKSYLLNDNRADGVSCTIHTTFNATIEDALEKHNAQCRPIDRVQLPKKIHDRFLIIDRQVYLMGNSLKDMGHTLSAAILTGFTPEEVITMLK